MDIKIKIPELKCMDPENYRKYFRALCWSGTRYKLFCNKYKCFSIFNIEVI